MSWPSEAQNAMMLHIDCNITTIKQKKLKKYEIIDPTKIIDPGKIRPL